MKRHFERDRHLVINFFFLIFSKSGYSNENNVYVCVVPFFSNIMQDLQGNCCCLEKRLAYCIDRYFPIYNQKLLFLCKGELLVLDLTYNESDAKEFCYLYGSMAHDILFNNKKKNHKPS